MTISFDHDAVARALRTDPEFGYLSRTWTATLRFTVDDQSHDLRLDDGTVTSFGPAGQEPADVSIVGNEKGWTGLLAGSPEAAWALMMGSPDLRMDADLIAVQAGYGRAIRRLVKVLRTVHGVPATEVALDADPFPDTDTAVGRYVRVTVEGSVYRMYYEEAGQGVPLLLQHTAGADGRQWRHLLADPQMQAKYRMIAYDLPFHGRSLPPVVGDRWWEHGYEPGRELLMQWVVALKQALDLDRPIIMGVSAGGQLAPDLLAHHGEHFRGAVGVNGTYHNESLAFLDNSPFDDPRIPREYFSTLMYEATSAIAPEPLRRENQWIYSTNGPGVYRGDNLYYSAGHDLRIDGHLIDTARTPLYAVVGEFDPVNGAPGGPQEIPGAIPGAKFAVLPGCSHFAMADDPVRFNAAILPILDEVVAAAVPTEPASR
jgi:pimeloyl-ACP methyl ester carboxylesterase